MGNILLNKGNHPKSGGNSVADQINRIKAQGPSNAMSPLTAISQFLPVALWAPL